jgi:hypothetical protein
MSDVDAAAAAAARDAAIMGTVLGRVGEMFATMDLRQTAMEERITTGDANTRAMLDLLDSRRMADTTTVTDSMATMQATIQGNMQTMMQALTQMQMAIATQTPPPATPPGIAASPSTAPDAHDPWWNRTLGQSAPRGQPPHREGAWPSHRDGAYQHYDQLRSKDFSHIVAFNGDILKFPDWSDRMAAKFYRTHPKMTGVLKWAEEQTATISEQIEKDCSEADVDLAAISVGMYDIITDRTGPNLYDKRRNAGGGRGLEFWRTLRRDYGLESKNATAARLGLYMKPGRCSSTSLLGEALDRWETLGREVAATMPIEDHFKLLSLQELIPKSMAEQMACQESLKDFHAALLYVRRQVADQRHSKQVSLIQRENTGVQPQSQPVPMDVSNLFRQVAALNGDTYQEPAEDIDPANWRETLIAAVYGKKGNGKGKGQEKETRECYHCGKIGHLARDCRSAAKVTDSKSDAKTDGKVDGKAKGKGGSKGKNWSTGAAALEEVGVDEGFTLGCLTKAPTALCSMSVVPETWQGFVCVETILDSGAGECVCGPDHFVNTKIVADAGRNSVHAEYVTADGGRLYNFGEKAVTGQTGDGERLSILFQVTSVDKPLIAVSKLTAAGHHVHFEKNGGVVTHGSTGRSTAFEKKNGVYILKIWVPQAAADVATPGGTRR